MAFIALAVDLTPCWVQALLGLNGHGLHAWQTEIIRQPGAFVDRLVLHPTRPARPVGGCALLPIICMLATQSRSTRVRFSRSIKRLDLRCMGSFEYMAHQQGCMAQIECDTQRMRANPGAPSSEEGVRSDYNREPFRPMMATNLDGKKI